MKLSIITVNLNNAAGLEKTAESIVSQTFNDFEWIVIDGGSTDGSVDVIRKYADHIAYWVSEKDSGIYNAMNKGVKVVKGEYLQFLNSGDWLADNKVLEDVFNDNPKDMILYGDAIYVKGSAIVKKACFEDQISLCHYFESSLCHQASFIPRTLLLKYPYNESLKIASDWEFFLKMMLDCYPFKHIHRVVCNFDYEGISSIPMNINLNNKERLIIRDKIVPDCVQYDYSNGKVGELISLRRKYPFYGKLITASILFMKRIDSVLQKFHQ